MSNKLLTVVLRVMEVIIQSITFISIAAIIILVAIGESNVPVWRYLLIVVPVTLAYLIRRYIKRFGLFYLLNALLLGYSILLGSNDSEYFFYFLLFLMIVGYSIRLKVLSVNKGDISELPLSMIGGDKADADEQKRTLQADEQMSVYFVVCMVFGYMVGQISDVKELCNIQVVLCVLFILLQVVYNNLKKLNTVFIRNEGKAEFPAAQIKRVNTFIIVALVIMMFVGMMLFYQGDYGNIFTIIGSAGLAIIRVVLKIFIAILGLGGGQQNDVVQQQTTASTEETLEAMEQVGTSPLAEALSVAFTVLVLCAIVIGLIYALIRYVKHFNEAREEKNDLVEYVKPVRTRGMRKNKKMRDADNTGEMNWKLRKLYRKRVLKGSGKEGPDKTQMPTELTQANITEDPGEAEHITRLYEKARYSDQSVTKEELEKMKNLS